MCKNNKSRCGSGFLDKVRMTGIPSSTAQGQLLFLSLILFHKKRDEHTACLFPLVRMTGIPSSVAQGKLLFLSLIVFHKKRDEHTACLFPLVRMTGIEPAHLAALDPKSSVSTSSTTSA